LPFKAYADGTAVTAKEVYVTLRNTVTTVA